MQKDLHVSSLLDVYGFALSQKQRELCEYYFNDDLSLAEISQNEGITRQCVCDHIKRAEKRLYELEKQCGYEKKFSSLKALAVSAENGDEIANKQILKIRNTLEKGGAKWLLTIFRINWAEFLKSSEIRGKFPRAM